MTRNLTVVPGSLRDLASRNGASLAESFLSADVIILIDVSGSMAACDARGGQQRYQVACDELAQLQAKIPGKIAVVAFSDDVLFIPCGTPPFLSGGTALEKALQFVQVADGCVDFIVISDGIPNNMEGALSLARTFTSKISTVYVGPETSDLGVDFLRRLAQAAGGRYTVAEKANELAGAVETLMLAERAS